MITIRISKTRREAMSAKKILESGGIKSNVTEDKFNNIPIQKFGVQARFRLKVFDRDFKKTAEFLAIKLKDGRA